MDKRIIDNYDKYYKAFFTFQHNLTKPIKKYTLKTLFNTQLRTELNLNQNEISFETIEIPIIKYNKFYDPIVIFKNKDKYLIVQFNSPYYDNINNHNLDSFYNSNFFLKLLNEKNKINLNESNDDKLTELKNEFELERQKKINLLDLSNNNYYNELNNLSIREVLLYNKLNTIYNNKQIGYTILNSLMIHNYNLEHNIKIINYDDNLYILINKELYGYNIKNDEFNKVSNKEEYDKIIDSENIIIPVSQSIKTIKNNIKKNILIDNSLYYDKDFKSSIHIISIDNNNDYEQYINDNLYNKESNITKEQKHITKEIKLNLDDNIDKSKDILIISDENIELNANEYSYEVNNKNNYNLNNYEWRNLLDNSNMDYNFIYKDMLWSSVNHVIKYLETNDSRYSLDYDNIFHTKKNNNNYIGYSESKINIDNYNNNYEDIIFNRIIQNNELIDILSNTNNAILKDNYNNELSNLMNVRNKIKEDNKKYIDIKNNYLEYNELLKEFSNIVIKHLNNYEDLQLNKIIINEVEKLDLFKKHNKIKKEYSDLFEIIKHNYFIL